MKKLLYLLSLLLLSFSPAFAQSSYTVTSPTDDGSVTSVGTLSWAITQANSNADNTLITFTVSSVTLHAALPEIIQSCSISGFSSLIPATGSGGTTIERSRTAANFGIFKATTAGTTLFLQDLILQNGVATEGANFRGGGGLLAELGLGSGGLTMSRCLVRNCLAIGGDGGGVQLVSGSAISTDCQFASNTAMNGGYGGGFTTGILGTLNEASVSFQRCTFVDNRAIYGGGFYHQIGAASLVNCTFSDNFSEQINNAIWVMSGSVDLVHSAL